MSRLPTRRSLALMVALGCWSLPAVAWDGQAATMKVDGRNAFLDEVKQKASAKNVPVQDGSTVRTGEQTSARLDLIPQGQVQVNANSSQLVTLSFLKSTRCAALQLLRGEIFIHGSHVCFLTNVGAVSGISRSQINLKVDDLGTVLTVIEGMAELERPVPMQVLSSEQLVVMPNGEFTKQNIGPEAAERAIEWTKGYFKKMSWGKKVLIGLGVLAGAAAVHEATKGDGGDHHPPPPPPAGDQPESVDPSGTSDGPQNPPPPPTPPSPFSDDVIRAQPVPHATVLCCHPVNGTWLVERVDPAQCGWVVGPDEYCGPPVK